MNSRRAALDDLPRVKDMYTKIVANMKAHQIHIWDDIYPTEFLKDDIIKGRLHLLLDHDELLASFALCDANDGAACVEWEEKDAKALYIDRLGVNVEYLRKGVGLAALKQAVSLAREAQARYLRLFVVEGNDPAIRLYQRAGFQQAAGRYDEVIDEALTLREYGFEIKV